MKEFIKQDIICVSHATVVQNDERRVQANVIGRIKASINAKINLVEVDFNNIDEDKVFASDLLIWMKSDGSTIGLKPTLEVHKKNRCITTIVAQIAYRKEESQNVITRTSESFRESADIETEIAGGFAHAA